MAHNDPAGAIAHWERALEHKGRQPLGVSSPIVVRKQLAGALLQAGRPRDARRQLQIVLGGEPDAEAFWLLSRAYLQEGAGTQALAAWEKARRFREENPLVPEPAPRVGSAVCAKCHSTTFRSQQRSRHSRTFFRVAELTDLNLPAPSIPDPFQPTVKHTLAWSGPELHQETRAEGQIFKAVVEYAFGSGDRGLTLVGRNDRGEARELRLSHYHDGTTWQWDVTTGHLVQPTDIEEYLGRPLTDDSVRRCLVCHVTDPQAVLTASGPLATDRGIGCERCHGPGGNHLLAVAAKFPDLAIADPTTVSGSAVVKLCAQCHSPRGREVLPEELTAVRFQGTTLTWSRCYSESNNTLDCTTCHDPHRNVVTSSAHYEARCLSCHDRAARSDGSTARPQRNGPAEAAGRTTCPVNPKSGCISCHMPAVTKVVPHSSFTDHFIRVHRD